MKAASSRSQIDPITLEVIRHGIISICDQIDANMTRTAFSPYIYEYKDYAVGFVSATGELMALIAMWQKLRADDHNATFTTDTPRPQPELRVKPRV